MIILALYACSLILFGFLVDTPAEIFSGIYQIITSPDTLITDYMGVGGLGAALVNSGCLSLIVVIIFRQLKLQINGFSFASFFIVTGFGLFGKNIFNIWFIMLGVWLYAKNQQKSFKEVIYITLFGTALAPVTTEVLFSTASAPLIKIPLAILISLGMGFVLIPLSKNLFKVHEGFSLYNMGFTAGILGIIVVSLLNSYGIIPAPQMIWTSENTKILSWYLMLMFLSMIITGIYLERKPWGKIKYIWESSGQMVTDFVVLTGMGPSLINMGINGFIVTSYILLVGGDLNGPTMGGILTVVGFSALGKHAKNITPILIGIYLGSIAKPLEADAPSMLLAALFGTNLAPIAGKYGLMWGIIAGFIHSSAVQSVGVLHGGLNLYNNGFAAGIVAAILLPIVRIFQPDKD